MKLKKISIFLVMILLILTLGYNVYASSAVNAMSGMQGGGTTPEGTGKIGELMNTAIGLIQFSGTGLSLIMVTMLGVKYIIAAPNDKAEVKKQIMPLLIGCIILFASVNLVQIIANFTTDTIK